MEEEIKLINERIENLDHKVVKSDKTEEVDIEKLLKPLETKFDNVEDKVAAARSSSAGLKDKMDEIKDSIQSSHHATKAMTGQVDSIKQATAQTQKEAAGLKAGISSAVTNLKQLSGSIGNSLGKAASKDDVKKSASAVNDGIEDALNDAADAINGNVKEVLKKPAGALKDVHKVAQKNQKYLKRIYRDVHR